MIQGMELATLANSLVETRNHKKDYVAETRAMRLTDDAKVSFKIGKQEHQFAPTAICLGQIGDRVGIPRKYAERMRDEAPALLAKNVNHWFTSKPEKRMLRTLQNGSNVARAFLSDRYRALDNADIAEKILPRLVDMGLEIKSAAITEQRLYIQAVSPKVEAEIKKVGDIVQSGIVISNSEVGMGNLNMRHLLYTLRCTNGLIAENIVKQHHVSRKSAGGDEEAEAFEYLSDETRQADDKAFWLRIGDVMTHTLSKEKFDKIIAQLNKTVENDIEQPLEAVEMLATRFVWQENEKESVLNHLIRGGDLTQYGLLNAVTRTAQDLPSYDRAVEFERQGGEIMLLKPTDFENN